MVGVSNCLEPLVVEPDEVDFAGPRGGIVLERAHHPRYD